MNWAMLASPPPPLCWPAVCSFSQNPISKVHRTIQSLTCLAGGKTSLWAPHIRPSLCWDLGDGKGNWPPHLAESAARTQVPRASKPSSAVLSGIHKWPLLQQAHSSAPGDPLQHGQHWELLRKAEVRATWLLHQEQGTLLVTRVSSMQMPTVQQPLLVPPVLHQIFDQATGSDTTTLSCLFQTP